MTSDTVTTHQTPRQSSESRPVTIGLWVLQAVLALGFLGAGVMKLTGEPQMIAVFDSIGAGDWLRYLVGVLEVAGAVALVIPRLCGLAALAFVGLMSGAVLTHVLVVGGSPLPAVVLGVLAGVIAWGRRRRTASLLAGLTGRTH